MNIKISQAETLLFKGITPYTKKCDIYIIDDKIAGVEKEPENFEYTNGKYSIIKIYDKTSHL